MISFGSITLPNDLEIFFPSFVHHPWANILFGGSISAANRKAGQIQHET